MKLLQKYNGALFLTHCVYEKNC